MIVRHELRVLYYFWMHPARRAVLIPDAYKVCFSMAVDASWDKKYKIARDMLRVGSFIKLLFDDNGKPLDDPFPEFEGRPEPPEYAQRNEEHCKLLLRTRTDRGLVLFLDAFHTCGCLRPRAEEMKQLPRMGKCCFCKTQLPITQLKMCSRCRFEQYCSPACQRGSWNTHKRRCRALAQGLAAAAAAASNASAQPPPAPGQTTQAVAAPAAAAAAPAALMVDDEFKADGVAGRIGRAALLPEAERQRTRPDVVTHSDDSQ
mmetsp:Transcript_27735/g.74641  ORF Transcript_27735/g.74641 Transcript_27735/m.74641 type:complete len:260 (-) Transcript_27735:91-870(-)